MMSQRPGRRIDVITFAGADGRIRHHGVGDRWGVDAAFRGDGQVDQKAGCGPERVEAEVYAGQTRRRVCGRSRAR